eukprot:scaffold8200_cov277-Pinguiococcus_pyrenoidosus.AAC.2
MTFTSEELSPETKVEDNDAVRLRLVGTQEKCAFSNGIASPSSNPYYSPADGLGEAGVRRDTRMPLVHEDGLCI